MGQVKSAMEKAMEKIREIEGLSPEEREDLKARERLRAALSLFYKGELARDQIWEQFKGLSPSLLREAQAGMADSLRLEGLPEEFALRRDGILAVAALRNSRNAAAIEDILNTIGRLQREYQEAKGQAAEELRSAIEANPQLRIRPVRTPDGRMVMEPTFSVDEAVQARLAEFLDEHEKRYENAFTTAVNLLKRELG